MEKEVRALCQISLKSLTDVMAPLLDYIELKTIESQMASQISHVRLDKQITCSVATCCCAVQR